MAKVARANPASASNADKAKAVVLSAFGVGGVGLGTVFLLEKLVPKVIKLPAQQTTTAGTPPVTTPVPLTPQQLAKTAYMRAIASGVLGLAGALGVFIGVKAKGTAGHVAATISGGLGVGGVIDAGMRIRQGYMATRNESMANYLRAAGYIVPSLPSGYTAMYSQPNPQAMYIVR